MQRASNSLVFFFGGGTERKRKPGLMPGFLIERASLLPITLRNPFSDCLIERRAFVLAFQILKRGFA